ncbi:MAG: homoserine kinase [Firmicutes bacterium]|nr:homoserine kinase [Bacillota bacterium]
MSRQVAVAIPASTANLGPGFDCLGMALGIYNEVQMEAEEGFVPFRPFGNDEVEIEISGEGGDLLNRSPENLVCRSAGELFRMAGKRPKRLKIRCDNRIPLARGMGSSSAAIVGGLVAANALLDEGYCQEGYRRNEMLEVAARLEGHPDNVASALLGGITVTLVAGERLLVRRIPPPEDLAVILAVPTFALRTSQARKALPAMIPFSDAVFNISRTAYLVALLSGANAPDGDPFFLAELADATEDRLHQPYRAPLIPGFADARRAAREAGAMAVALSGAGPAVAAFSRKTAGDDQNRAIGAAMQEAFSRNGISSNILITAPSITGAEVKK